MPLDPKALEAARYKFREAMIHNNTVSCFARDKRNLLADAITAYLAVISETYVLVSKVLSYEMIGAMQKALKPFIDGLSPQDRAKYTKTVQYGVKIPVATKYQLRHTAMIEAAKQANL